MSFLSPSIPDDTQAVQNQSWGIDGVLPVVFGSARLPLRALVCDRWNFTENDDGDKRPKGYWQSLAGLICNGPIDAIRWGYNNGEWTGVFDLDFNTQENTSWVDYNNAGTVDEYAYVFNDWGDFGFRADIYPGRQRTVPMRMLDGVGLGKLKGSGGSFYRDSAPDIHPPYAGYAAIVVHAMSASWPASIANSDTLPSLEFVVYRELKGWPKPSNTAYKDHGENPIAIVYEVMTNKRWGLGWDNVNYDSFYAAAERFVNDGWYKWTADNIYRAFVSPTLKNETEAKTFIRKILNIIDAYIYMRDGQWCVDFDSNKTTTYGGLPVLRKKYFTSVSTLKREALAEAADIINVSYTDTSGWPPVWEDDAFTLRNAQLFAIKGRRTADDEDIPYVLRKEAALAFGQRRQELEAQLLAEGDISILESAAKHEDGSEIVPGNYVQVEDDDLPIENVYKVITSDEQNGSITFSLKQLSNVSGDLPDIISDEKGEEEIPDPVDLGDVYAIEYPANFEALTGMSGQAGLFAERSDYTKYAEVYLSSTGTFTGEESRLDNMSYFADLGAYVDLTYVGNSWQLTFTINDDTWSLSHLSESYSAADQLAGKMIIVVNREFFSLGQLITVDGQQYTYAVTRGFAGSPEMSHYAGDVAIIQPVEYWYSIDRPELANAEVQDTTYYKLAPVTQWSSGNTGDTVTLTLDSSTILADTDGQFLGDEDGTQLYDTEE